MLTVKDFINRFILDKGDLVQVWSADTTRIEFYGTFNELEKSEYADKTIDSINTQLYGTNTPCLCFNVI